MQIFKILVVVAGLHLVACSSSKSSVGVGAYTDAIKSVSGNDDGSTGWFAPFSYPVGLKTRFGNRNPFIVAVDYTPLAKKGPEGALTSRYLLARTLVGLGWGLSIGPSLVMHTQKGTGEVLQLNNGNSTSPFATPNSSVTSKIFAMNIGFDYTFGRWSLGNEIFWQGFMTPSRWNFAWLVSLHYQFGGSSKSSDSSGEGEKK